MARASDGRKALWILLCLGALVPMVHMSGLVRQYSVEVPSRDDWEMAPLIVKAHSGQLTFADLYAQQEEARYLLPKLIFILSAAGGHWDVRDLVLFSVIASWLTAAGVFFLLYRSGLNLGTIAVCFWLMVLCLFSPAQFELWIFASGFPCFLPALFLVVALVTLETGLSTLWKFVICAVLAFASSFTLAHGLLAWGLTFPVLLLVRPVARWKSWLFWWLICCALCAVAYFWDYQRPAYHPEFAPAASPVDYTLFILEYLGGGLAYSLKHRPAVAAAIFGALQLALFLAALAYAARRIRDRQFLAMVMPWFALGLYALGSAVLAALGRVKYGADYALASRYVTFSIWLTIALIALVAIISREWIRTRRSFWPRVSLLAACSILMISFLLPYRVAAANTRSFLRSWSQKDRLARAAVLFSSAINTGEVIKKTSYPGDAQVVQRAAALDRLQLLRPPLLRTNRLSGLPHAVADGKEAIGAVDPVTPIDGEQMRATGWAALLARGRPADCVAVAYQTPSDPEPVIFAISDVFEMRPAMVKRFRSMEFLWSGWAVTFPQSAVPPGAKLSFWAVDADQPKLYELPDDSSLKQR
ncbi:MAG TPA: hypothetical protein VEX43_14120 [Chthoniobacterales bacterium]|nr:hypothetical protein [Chthoniobacterales bacterium]